MKFMRHLHVVGLALAAMPLVGHTGETPNRIVLWNGHDLGGWRVVMEDATPPAAVWSAQGGVLRLDARSRGYVRTDAVYADCHLHFEWRWPVAALKTKRPNSGALLLINGPDKVWPASYEFQLLSGLGGEIVAFYQELPGGNRHADGFKRAKPLARSSERPLGEWNTAEVISRGPSLELLVNGVRQNRVEGLPVSSGHFALQLEGSPIEFRNIWLEPL